ncbi:hypothetical protein AB1K70_17270 [Bremerella sp. JC770]|uniref:hypothetical protein n=1 Tax=Bremerella sp. JC770 TaxID=3232137 RepID=UPI0034585A88
MRFSLKTMLVGAIVLTLIASNLFTSWHLFQAQQLVRVQQMEIDALRRELRSLDTSDRKNVHVIAMETNQDMVWKWRIFIPPGKKFNLKSMVGTISDRSFPEGAMVTPIEPGEGVLTCSVTRNAGGDWDQDVRYVSGAHVATSTLKVFDSSMAWYGKQGSSTTSGSITTSMGQQSFSGEHRIELLRFRRWIQDQPNVKFAPTESTDGILFWLEPVERSPFPDG